MTDLIEEQTQRALQQLQEMQEEASRSNEAKKATLSPPLPPVPQPGTQNLLRFLHLDSDTLLILPLVLLLSREGADDPLLLALLYILL